MNTTRWLMVVVVAVLAGSVIWAIRRQTQEPLVVAGPFRVTMYSEPRQLHVGEALVAFRIQDRQFRILTNLKVNAWWRPPQATTAVVLPLNYGQGKDYRHWIQLSKPGEAVFTLVIEDDQGRSVRVHFRKTVAPVPSKK